VVQNIAWRNGAGRLGIGVLNERGQTQVREPSVCNYLAGFNDVLDDYGPDTPRNAYDLRADPLFVDPEGADGVAGGEIVDGQFIDRSADDDFRLRQSGGEISPAVDAGSTSAARLGLTGATASSGAADTGRIDLGYHYGASATQVLAYETPFMPLYVRANGKDTSDGMSPGTAFATIGTAARRARAGVTVVVGPGVYRECDLHSPPDSGRAFFVADAAGERTGDPAGVTLVNPGQCNFDPIKQEFSAGQTGFNLSSVCGVIVDGFHVTGASDDGIAIQNQSDGAVVRNNVVFANTKRGINVVNSDDVRIADNLAYGDGGGIQIGSGSRAADACADGGSRRAVIEFNTTYKSTFNGIQVGAGLCPSTNATVRYNVTGENGLSTSGKGIEVGRDESREQELVGYESSYNLVADRYGTGVPRGVGDLLIDLTVEPLYLDPTAIVVSGDWRTNRNFRLAQRDAGDPQQSRGVDFSDLTALKAGMSTRSTRSDGQADTGLADLGYHYPAGGALIGDCNGDGVVMVNEIVLAVNVALGSAPLSACPAASSDGAEVTIADLIQAVGSGLQGNG
ncbi:MAG TPA: right-handed parallel beta-helix repeat-containing protein, partial [Candidatus Dormibacteraeota bacterium]|nr:right-handed parallel beta-helix repeat-containing protein [Candidatus Dormibacteraeota bacterium]